VAVGGLKEEYFKTLLGLEDVLGRNVDLIEIEKCFSPTTALQQARRAESI
jgi:hypothetical protein